MRTDDESRVRSPVAQMARRDAQMERIDAVLGESSARSTRRTSRSRTGAFDLDDVMCAAGQYDIKLDADFAVTEERKE